MKKLILVSLWCAAWVWAADFWVAKPFTEWSAKDLQKMMSDSPWSHRVDIELGVRMPEGSAGGGRGGRGGGRGGSGDISTADGGPSVSGGGAGGRGGAPSASGPATEGPVTQTMPLTLLWQSALPLKQALMKAKYGSEVETTPDARTFLERPEQFFVLNVGGLPATAAGAAEGDKKETLLKLTSISAKGKDPIQAVEVQITRRERLVDAVFYFPRSAPGAAAPFTADDKDVEFSTKFDKLSVRTRFKLKDMVYHGKLEL